MCQLVIHVANTGASSDPQIEAARFQPGDVVAIVADNYQFGALDIGPHVKVVKFPGVAAASFAQLLLSDSFVVPVDTGVFPTWPRIRLWTLPNHATFAGTIVPPNVLTWIAQQAQQRAAVANAAAAIGQHSTIVV